MTPPLTLLDRKDIDTLISYQTDTPCLQTGDDGGYGTESVMAFIMQLYAYIFAKLGQDSPGVHCTADKQAEGTEALKAHLMTTGPYHVVIYTTDFRARPNALKLRKRPVGYSGASTGSWIILWPGAKRDNYFKMGRVVYAFQRATQNCMTQRADGAPATSAMSAILTNGGYRFSSSTLQKIYRPVRLIPP